MSRASQARKIAVAAAYGGGGLGLLTAGAFGLIRAEAALARRAIGEPTETPPDADGVYGRAHGGTPISLVVLGDSSAGGLGVEHGHQTPGAMMAAGLAEVADQPVQLPGRRLRRGAELVAGRADRPHRGRATGRGGDHDRRQRRDPSRPPGHGGAPPRPDAVRRLREAWAPRSSSAPARTSAPSSPCPSRCAGSPDARAGLLPRPRPSRSSMPAGAASRSATSSGPEFAASPGEMFGPDGFHPSVAGYASAAAVLLPSLGAALGFWFDADEELRPDLARGEGVRPVSVAAAEAADVAGTEVAGAQVAGRDRGPRGQWALLRRRPGQPAPDVQATAEHSLDGT